MHKEDFSRTFVKFPNFPGLNQYHRKGCHLNTKENNKNKIV